MNLPAPLVGLVPLSALASLPLFAEDADGTSGTRTVVGALLTLVVIAVVVSIGMMMGRGELA